MKEFFNDGVAILDFVKKRRADYFSKRGYKLIGCEVPIEVDMKKNIKMVGYLDIVILDEMTNTLKIYRRRHKTLQDPQEEIAPILSEAIPDRLLI